MKTYEITFKNGETRVMAVTSGDIDPATEVAKWHESARLQAQASGEEFVPHDVGYENIANIVEIPSATVA